MRQSPVAIVCGYDRFSDLHVYAEQVASEIAAARVERIIVTGGFTSRDSYHSEAWVMSRVLAAKLPHAVVVLEEWAMTTVDNLVFSRALALERFAAGSFLVFCDHAHRFKASVLTRIILGANATVRSIPRAVPWMTHALEPLSIVFESVCAVVPPLRKLLSRIAAWSKGLEVYPDPERSEGGGISGYTAQQDPPGAARTFIEGITRDPSPSLRSGSG